MRFADLEWHIARNLADRDESPVRSTESEANGCRQQLYWTEFCDPTLRQTS